MYFSIHTRMELNNVSLLGFCYPEDCLIKKNNLKLKKQKSETQNEIQNERQLKLNLY